MSVLPVIIRAVTSIAPAVESVASAFSGPGSISEKLGKIGGSILKSITGELPNEGLAIGYKDRPRFLDKVYASARPSGLEGDQEQWPQPSSHLSGAFKAHNLRQRSHAHGAIYHASNALPVYDGHGHVHAIEAYRPGVVGLRESAPVQTPNPGGLVGVTRSHHHERFLEDHRGHHYNKHHRRRRHRRAPAASSAPRRRRATPAAPRRKRVHHRRRRRRV